MSTPQQEAEAILHVLKAMEVQQGLLRRILALSFLGRTDEGSRLYFDHDWLDLSPLEAALMHSLES